MIACRSSAPTARTRPWSGSPAWRSLLADAGFWAACTVLLLLVSAALQAAWFPVTKRLCWLLLWWGHVAYGYPPPPDYPAWEV